MQVNFSYPRNYWDAHGDLRNNHTTNAARVDLPIAALLRDLKSEAPLEYRCDFAPLQSNVSGIEVGERLPMHWLNQGQVFANVVTEHSGEFGHTPRSTHQKGTDLILRTGASDAAICGRSIRATDHGVAQQYSSGSWTSQACLTTGLQRELTLAGDCLCRRQHGMLQRSCR